MKKKVKIFLGTLIAVLAPAVIVYAALNTLNGQNGASQTFSNDTNVTITSASNVHSLGWSGALATSRGGTGTSTWQTGSIPFFDGTRLTEERGFKYDFANWPSASGQRVLILGTDQNQAVIQAGFGTANNPDGKTITITGGWGYQPAGNANGGGVNIFTGDFYGNGHSGNIDMESEGN